MAKPKNRMVNQRRARIALARADKPFGLGDGWRLGREWMPSIQRMSSISSDDLYHIVRPFNHYGQTIYIKRSDDKHNIVRRY